MRVIVVLLRELYAKNISLIKSHVSSAQILIGELSRLLAHAAHHPNQISFARGKVSRVSS